MRFGSLAHNARMAEPKQESEGHPVLAGLLALLGVGLAVGLLVSGAALAGTSVLGVGEERGHRPGLERPVGLRPQAVADPGEDRPGDHAGAEAVADGRQLRVRGGARARGRDLPLRGRHRGGSGSPIDLSGVYPGHEGATLVVQRFEDGDWVDFADGDVTTTVSDETFSTYVVT